MEKVLYWLKNRLREYTTWAGIMLVSSSFGVQLTLDQQLGISVLGMALAGASNEQLAAVFGGMRGLFAKGAPVIEQQEPIPETQKPVIAEKPKTIKEVVNEDSKKSVDDLLARYSDK